MPQRPRLLLILTEFPPSFGGMQTHAVHLCRYLSERGYPIAVATYRASPGDDTDAADRLVPCPVHRELSRIGFRENLRTLERLNRGFRAELIYSSTVFYGHLRERCGVPVVCRSAGNDVLRPWIAWPYSLFSGLVSTPWIEHRLYERFRRLEWPERVEMLLLERRRAVMRDSVRRVDRVLANSEYTAGLLTGLGVEPSRVQVLPGGVDAARFAAPAPGSPDYRAALRRSLGLPADAYILMTACRLVPKKGLEFLLAALERLRAPESMPDAHLVVAGDGRSRDRLERLAASLGLGSAVTFAGRIEHDALARWYHAADQFVLASREHVDPRTGLRDVETMGRVLCEANAAGVPVVASRSGGIPSVIRHKRNGLLFREENRRQLLDAVRRIRSDTALAARLREEGLRRARREFDWRVIFEAHEHEFERALRGGGATVAAPASGEFAAGWSGTPASYRSQSSS